MESWVFVQENGTFSMYTQPESIIWINNIQG
jgi:hypothetical protein